MENRGKNGLKSWGGGGDDFFKICTPTHVKNYTRLMGSYSDSDPT